MKKKLSLWGAVCLILVCLMQMTVSAAGRPAPHPAPGTAAPHSPGADPPPAVGGSPAPLSSNSARLFQRPPAWPAAWRSPFYPSAPAAERPPPHRAAYTRSFHQLSRRAQGVSHQFLQAHLSQGDTRICGASYRKCPASCRPSRSICSQA